MKHYDGPAFYRKYGQPVPKTTWEEAPQSASLSAAQASSASSASSADSPKRESAKVEIQARVYAPKPQHSAKQSAGSLQRPETHVTFTPGKMANTMPTRTPAGQVNTQIFDPVLRLVMQRLKKSLASFFLLASDAETANSTTQPVVDSQATVVFMPTDSTSTSAVVVDIADSNDPQNNSHAIDAQSDTVVTDGDSVASSAVADQLTAASVHSAGSERLTSDDSENVNENLTENPVVIDQSADNQTALTQNSANVQELAEETAATNLQSDSQLMSDSSENLDSSQNNNQSTISAKSETNQMGLGVSLNDIFDEEDNAQKDLALFKKPATVENEGEAYQPVGVAPVKPTERPVVNEQPLSETQTSDEESAASKPASAEALFKSDKELAAYHFPPLSLLTEPIIPDETEMDEWIQTKADALDQSLKAFGVNANVVDWTVGPTVTQFQVKLAQGVRVSKITNLNDDLKLALAAKDIRIEAPIPGRNTVGIEIPNQKSRPVMLAEVLNSTKFQNSKSPLTVALGVDLFGQPQVTDLRKMPHGLIAGATGSGKSVFINSILMSILYKANPQQVKLLLIDPKAVELAPYNDVPHLIAPVISEPKAASAALKWVVDEMEDRYQRLAAGGVRNIEQFNEAADEHHEPALKMPYIVIVIDELADLMMVASSEVQDYIARITQKARAAGIHLLVATQRPSVDVVTGTIKNNIPTRVAFMVASQIDSRTILDASGAERLLGRGDMLYLGNGQSQPIRLQGTFVDHEIDAITSFVKDQAAPHYEFQPDNLMKHDEAVKNQDDLLPDVLEYIADEDTVSTSKLQRTFSVGYNRAANIIDDLENRNYISPAKGSKPRDVYFDQNDLASVKTDA